MFVYQKRRAIATASARVGEARLGVHEVSQLPGSLRPGKVGSGFPEDRCEKSGWRYSRITPFT